MFKNQIKDKWVFFGALFIILGLSITVTWFNLGTHKTFAGEDYGFGYDYPKIPLTLSLFNWDSFTALGKSTTTSTITLLWTFFIFFLSFLKLNSIFIERLIYFLFFAISGLGLFFLSNLLLSKYYLMSSNKTRYIAALTGSILYMFNHFTSIIVAFTITSYHLSFMLLPWLIFVLLSSLKDKVSFFNIFIFSLLILVISGGNPSNTISIVFLLVLFFIVFIKDFGIKFKVLIKFCVLSLMLFLLFSSYIYLPMLGMQTNPYGEISVSNDLIAVAYNSRSSSFLNLLRLGGNSDWHRFSYYTPYMENVLIVMLGYLITFMVLFPIFSTKSKKIKVFFIGVVTIFLFLAKGTHPSLENLFYLLFLKVPYFQMYRAVYHKFVFFISFSYAVLISIFIVERKKLFLTLFVPIAILIYNFPFFSNQIVYRHLLTEIPKEYISASKEIAKDKQDFKILSLPTSSSGGGLILKWTDNNYYIGPHPDHFFFNRPVLDSYWFIKNTFNNLEVTDSWIGNKFEKDFEDVIKYLGILNIKYLLIHKDSVEGYDFGNGTIKIDGKLKSSTLISILSKQKGIKLVKENKFFNLYKVPDKSFLHHFYIPNKVVNVNNNIKNLLGKQYRKYFNDKVGFFDKNIKILSGNFQTLSFIKVNPIKYKVKVSNASGSFPIIFSETYNEYWKMYIKNQKSNKSYFDNNKNKEVGDSLLSDNNFFETLTKEPLPKSSHILANGYANSWLLNTDKLCSVPNNCIKNPDGSYDFEVVVEFWPQRLFYFGLFISGTTLLSCIGYLIFNSLKKPKHLKSPPQASTSSKHSPQALPQVSIS